jgi:hypothetical protein
MPAHRTKSPIRVKHKLVLKVYFSVAGETLTGEPLHGEPEGAGDLRMLMVNLPELLPSVSISPAHVLRSELTNDSCLVLLHRRMGPPTRM